MPALAHLFSLPPEYFDDAPPAEAAQFIAEARGWRQAQVAAAKQKPRRR